MTLSDDATAEVINILSNRVDLLNTLSAEPKDKRELVEEFDISRSTVDRGVRELEVLGMVEYVSGGLVPTCVGRLLAQEYRDFEGRVASILDAQNVLATLDENADIDSRLLAEADIIPADSIAPYKPGAKVMKMVREADRCRLFSRAHTYGESSDMFHDEIVNGQMETEVVFKRQMYNHLQDEDQDSLREIVECENCTCYVAETVPFGFYLLERGSTTHVVVVVYGADNQYRGLIANDSEGAIEWGERIYREYKQKGERATL